jgi:hypothetical protein
VANAVATRFEDLTVIKPGSLYSNLVRDDICPRFLCCHVEVEALQ